MATAPASTPSKDREGPAAVESDAGPDSLAAELRISVMRLARRLRVETSDETLTFTQLSALASVLHHGPLSPTALAELERVQPPSMTRVIAILEERGLTARAPHPRDGRQSVIAITPAGQEIVEENRRRRTAWLATAMGSLGEEERAALHAAAPIIERLARL